MSELRTTAYLEQMRTAAVEARTFVSDLDRDGFLANRRTQQAVVMSLMIIGEAAARMIDRHPEFVAQNKEVPWTAMRGLRNRIAHGYFQVDMEIVWTTVQTALPEPFKGLEPLLQAP